MIQRNVVFQSKTDTGESVLNMPITVLKNIEDTAEIKDNISDDDYVPVIDSSDNSQMKKTNFKNAIASKADKSDVEAALDNKSNVNHIHDERYYTESEVDTKLSGKIDTTLKGSANGIAELNENGKVPSSQLPSYVDAVVEYTSISDFPSTGDTGKIYVDTTTNLTYRWSGSAYVEISPSIALGETSSTAYRGDRGKAAYDHIADTTTHITAEERAAWDAKADLSDIPTELPANGGNADTVNGHTVNANVPADAVFTDTTYSAGTGLSLSGTTFNHKNSITAGTAQGDATKTLTFGGTFAIPTVTYDAQGHITGKGTTTMTMPSNPNTDTKVTSVANHYTPSADSKASLSASASGATAAWGIDVVKGVTLSRDAKGHVTDISVTSGKIPANPNTDTKVTNTLATTTKAYVTGTTSANTNTGTQVFDTGVYLDTIAGQIVAKTFKGALSGNASTATALTSSAGTNHIPVRFSNGKPVAVSEILKYNTGSLPHGNTTISYASGYKYALIFAYSNQNMSEQAYLQPLTITWAGNMSSTTSYDTKTITKSGPNKLTFTVTKGNIILNNSGAEYYNYLVIWSN